MTPGHLTMQTPILPLSNGVPVKIRRSLIFTARKRSLRRLCFYTCLSFCPGGGGGGVRVTWHTPLATTHSPRQPCMPPRQPHMPPPAATHAPPAATHAPPRGSHACPPLQPRTPPPCSHAHPPPPAATHAPPDTGNLHFHCRNTFFTSFFHIYIELMSISVLLTPI